MRSLFFLLLTIFTLSACMPPAQKSTEQSGTNAKDIENLELQIEELTKRIAKEEEEIPLTDDPNYNELKANLDELRSDLIRMIQELENKFDTRISSLESNYTSFIQKLESLDDKYVSIEDFESLKIQLDVDYAKKQELIDLQIANSENPDELQAFSEQINALKRSQRELEKNYKVYYQRSLKEWNDKLIANIQKSVNQGLAAQQDKIVDFVRDEIARVSISIEAQKKEIKANQVLIQAADRKLADEISKQQDSISGLSTTIHNLIRKYNSLKSGQDAQATSITELNSLLESLSSKSIAQIKGINTKIEEIQKDSEQKEETVLSLKDSFLQLTQENDSLKDMVTDLKKKTNQVLYQLKQSDSQQIDSIKQLRQAITTLENTEPVVVETPPTEVRTEVRTEVTTVEVPVNNPEYDQKIADLKNKISELEGKIPVLERDLDDQQQLNDSLKEEQTQLQESLDAILTSHQDKAKKLSDLTELVKTEVAKLKRKDNQLTQNLEALYLIVEGLNTEPAQEVISEARIQTLETQIIDLKRQIRTQQERITEVSVITQSQVSDDLVGAIVENTFAPCQKGLKESPYCYTFGTIIQKLGGVFVDPMGYKRTEKDFIKFLVASGITIDSILQKTKTFLYPSDSTGRAKIRSCHPGTTHSLLGPQSVWPRLVILALMLEKVEKEIVQLTEIDEKNGSYLIRPQSGNAQDKVSPALFLNAWWRSKCYQSRWKSKNSDHMYGAAVDPQVSTIASFDYYVEYFKNHFIDNDTFGLNHPLKVSKLNFRTSLGHSDENAVHNHGKKKLHIGIGSEVSANGKKVNCDLWTYDKGSRVKFDNSVNCSQ